VAYDSRHGKAVLHVGALSVGTTNYAELAPYVQALWFHHQDHGLALARPVHVQIVSDSEVTVRCGSGLYARRANGCLWAALRWFEDNGYALRWRHVPRNSNTWSAWADELASGARRALAEVTSLAAPVA
jgi:hypothetical protein